MSELKADTSPVRHMEDVGKLTPFTPNHHLLDSNVNPSRGSMPKRVKSLFEEQTLESALVQAWTIYGTLQYNDRVITHKGKGTIEFYDLMMDGDSVLSGLIETRITAVAGLESSVVAAKEQSEGDTRNEEIAEFIRFAIDRLDNFEQVLEHILSACRMGFSITEIVWEEVEWQGRIVMVPDRLVGISPTLFRFDSDFNLRAFANTSDLQGKLVEAYKFLVHTFGRRYRNPYGVSLLRACYWPWWFKHNGLKYWLQAAERGAVLTPVGYYPEDATPDEITQIKEALRLFLGNKYLALQEGSRVDFPHIKIAPEFADRLRTAMNEEMMYRVLGATLSSGTAESGTRALGQVHDKRFQERIESDAKALMKTINRMVAWIVDFNYMDVEEYPEWSLNYEAPIDMKLMASTLEMAAKLGVPVSVKDAADLLQLPLAEEGEVVIQIQQAPAAAFGNPETEEEGEPEEEEVEEEGGDEEEAARLAALASAEVRKNRKEMEKLFDGAMRATPPVIDGIQEEAEEWLDQYDTIKEAIAAVQTYEPDVTELRTLQLNAGFLSTLHGLHNVFEIPKIKDKLGWGAIWRQFIKTFAKLVRATYEPVPPEEAIEMFEGRGILTREEFDLLEAHERRRALTAAGMTRQTIQTDLRSGLLRALRDGVAFPEFRDQVGGIVMSTAHAENIFRTNVMGAYNNGHAEGMWRPELRKIIPAVQFFAILDDRTTDICAERNGMIYKRDDMASFDIMPPCHFRCRSTIVTVTADEWDGKSAASPTESAQEGFGRWEPVLR